MKSVSLAWFINYENGHIKLKDKLLSKKSWKVEIDSINNPFNVITFN
jgi:hypothetical protein